MYRFVFVLCLIASVLMTGASVADIPKLINYQGMLTDDSGNPLTGTYDITFIIYDDPGPTGGNIKWSETQYDVSVINGLFNVILGSANPIDLPFDQDYWLDITVEGEHMPARLRFTSVGYAYRAMVADTAYATAPGAGSHWSVSDFVLYTNNFWGIARGGAGNVLYGDSVNTMVNLGAACTTGTSGYDAGYLTIGGGYGNSAGWWYATVGGGWNNSASDYLATIGGGSLNSASDSWATVGGGCNNKVSGAYATVGGGVGNTASEHDATVAGGFGNVSSGLRSTVGGGFQNIASGECSMVPGGIWNTASGTGSFAAGWRAKALHAGSFVWADSNDVDFASTGLNQFLIRASGGVGIGTTNPARDLHIVGDNPRILIEAKTISPEINFKNSGDPLSTVWALYKDGGTDDFKFYQNGDKVTIQNSTGNVGIGTTSPGSYKLAVVGTAAKSEGGGSWATFSDVRLKDISRSYEYGLSEISKLKPIRYHYKQENELGLPSKQGQVGLVAQDVQDVIPDAVSENDQGYLMLNSDPIIWAMLNAIKELKAENEELKERIEALEGK